MATPPDHDPQDERTQIAVTLRNLGALLLQLGDQVRRLPLWQGRAVYDPDTDEPRNDEAQIEGALALLLDEHLRPASRVLKNLSPPLNTLRDQRSGAVLPHEVEWTGTFVFPQDSIALGYGLYVESAGLLFDGLEIRTALERRPGQLRVTVLRRKDVSPALIDDCLALLTGHRWAETLRTNHGC